MFEKLVATFQQGEENCYSDRIKLKIELNTSQCIFLYLKSSYSIFFFIELIQIALGISWRIMQIGYHSLDKFSKTKQRCLKKKEDFSYVDIDLFNHKRRLDWEKGRLQEAIEELHNFQELSQAPDDFFKRLAQRTWWNHITQQHKCDL